MLVVPGVKVPVPFVSVKLPARFSVPAPPDIVMEAQTAVVAEELYTRLPVIVNVPVVMVIFETLPVDVLLPPRFTFPFTITVPVFMINDTIFDAEG